MCTRLVKFDIRIYRVDRGEAFLTFSRVDGTRRKMRKCPGKRASRNSFKVNEIISVVNEFLLRLVKEFLL